MMTDTEKSVREPTVLPMSAWTKKAIMKEAADMGTPERILDIMSRIPLSDLRPLVLRKVGTMRAGWIDGEVLRKPGRWTRYYELDMDTVNSIGGDGQ